MKTLIGLLMTLALVSPQTFPGIQSLRDRTFALELDRLIKKKPPQPDPAPDLQALLKAIEAFGLPTIKQDLLSFSSNEHIKAAYNLLDGQTRAYHQRLQKEYGEKEIPDEIAFKLDEHQPLADYEAKLGFKSLRSNLQRLQKEWFRNNKTDDETQDPTYQHIPDPVLQSLLNPYYELQIGDNFYKFTPTGYQTYKSYEELLRARYEQSPTALDGLTKPARLLQTRGCGTWFLRSGTVTSGKYRIRWVIAHVWLPWTYKAYTLTFNFRRVFWIWWPATSWTFARVYGYVSADLFTPCQVLHEVCAAKMGFNLNLSCYSWQWGFWTTHSIDVYHKTAPEWIRGHHYGITGSTYSSVLY